MAEDRGFIKINRKIADNWLWNNEKFSRGQAWVDLLLITQYKDGFFHSKKGRIDYKRGDCTLSLSDLAKRWGWTRDKVRTFLEALEQEEMIKRTMVKSTYSIVTVLNYDKYKKKKKAFTAKKNDKKDDDGFDYDRHLRFLLGDEYDEYMENKKKAQNG